MQMKPFILLAITYFISLDSVSQNAADRVTHFNIENKLALQGYDPVAYFKQNKAIKGSKSLAVSHLGIIYYFSSKINKDLFTKNPTAYEPQYGGWCAYAMGNTGEKVEIDPETFKIVNGKLYLFYNAYLTNTLKSWNKDEKNLLSKANKNWRIFFNK